MGVGRHWKDISLRMFWHVIGRRAGGTDICLNSASVERCDEEEEEEEEEKNRIYVKFMYNVCTLSC